MTVSPAGGHVGDGTAEDSATLAAAIATLAESPRELLAQIIALAPIGIGIVDADRRTILSNSNLRRMLGYSEEEFRQLPFEQYTHPGDIARNDELFDRLMSGEIDRFEMDKRFYHREGHVVWGRLTVAAMADGDGTAGRLAIGLLQDVTEERRLQTELAAAEASYRQMVEQVPAVVYSGDPAIGVPATYLSPRLEELLGFTPTQWYADGGLWHAQLHVDDRDAVLARYDDHLRSGSEAPVVLSYRMHHRDGSVVWLRDQYTITTEQDGTRSQRGVLVDVTREKLLEEELERQAFHDPLTQLANLRLFRLRIGDRMRRRPPRLGAVAFLDLDDFKTVNDSLGHGAGDQLLQEAARRITSCLRPSDTAGRLGGDEFALLLDEVEDRDRAVTIAERVRRALSEPFLIGDQDEQVRVGASIGVAMLTDGESTDTVLRAADLAMYAAKEAGKSRVHVYEPALLDRLLARLERVRRDPGE